MRRWLGPADAVLQQAAWWWAVLHAARGAPGLAAAGPLALVVAHLALRREERDRIVRAAAVAAVYGLATDALLARAGLARFAGGADLAPWMVGLWAVFGVALTASLARVAAWRWTWAAVAGALAGPLAYRAGAALGAIALHEPVAAAAAIAVQWAVAIPLLGWAARPGPAPEGGGRAEWAR